MNESAFNTGMFDYQRFKADVHLGAGAAGKTALLDGFLQPLRKPCGLLIRNQMLFVVRNNGGFVDLTHPKEFVPGGIRQTGKIGYGFSSGPGGWVSKHDMSRRKVELQQNGSARDTYHIAHNRGYDAAAAHF